MNLKNAVDQFIAAKEIENLSDRTIRVYTDMTRELVEYVGDKPLERFDEKDVREFLNYHRNRKGERGPLSDATIHKYYSIVRTLSRWLEDQGYIIKAPTDKVRPPRVENKLPEALSDEEINKLFVYLKSFCSKRVEILFSFFLDTGARLSEVVGLDLTDLHLDDNWVKVYGKGRRERILPLGKSLKKDLELYLSVIRPTIVKKGEKALFVTKFGERYSPNGLSTLIKVKLKAVNVNGKYGPHKLRHTFATNYLRNGGNLEQLRIVMGHRDISTTQRYLSLLPEDLTRAQLSASPMDRIKHRLKD